MVPFRCFKKKKKNIQVREEKNGNKIVFGPFDLKQKQKKNNRN